MHSLPIVAQCCQPGDSGNTGLGDGGDSGNTGLHRATAGNTATIGRGWSQTLAALDYNGQLLATR